MTTPRLRPMSDMDRPERIVVFWHDGRRTSFTPCSSGYRGGDTDIGWCTEEEAAAIFADLLERIKPPEPNPVYWGDEVKAGKSSRTLIYIAPSPTESDCALCETSLGYTCTPHKSVITYNGRPVTEFCHGLRPDDDEA